MVAVEAPGSPLCLVLTQNPQWARALRTAANRWGAPAPLIAAIIRQESNFRPGPAGDTGAGPSGYAQAARATWAAYRRETGNPGASRRDIAASVDFVGWYIAATHARVRVPYSNPEAHYLAYSRGWGASGPVPAPSRANAARVAALTASYERDLSACPLSEENESALPVLGG